MAAWGGAVAAAQESARPDWWPDALFAQAGIGEHAGSISTGVQWNWHRLWPAWEGAHVSARIEATLGRWRAQTDTLSDHQEWATQVSVGPAMRLLSHSKAGWYLEAGLGPSAITPRFHRNDTELSTRFQFRSHVGVGLAWGSHGRHDVGLRLEHFSNAGLRQPNPGVNWLALRYTVAF
jgi:lipid A 3-O-deacylase